jgi:hypothetical protein
MKRLSTITKIIVATIIITAVNILAVSDDTPVIQTTPDLANTQVDNNGYWKKMAELGLAELNPVVPVKKAIYTGSEINGSERVLTLDSPDVCVTGSMNANESENSIFIYPFDEDIALNSNNSGNDPISNGFYGANDLYTIDGGENWEGQVEGTGGTNSGDPTTAIGRDGRWFVGYITSGLGQGISYSDDEGETWTKVTVNSGSGATLDKNHLWIDNCSSSPYQGNLYNAWTPMGFSHTNNNEIELCYSHDNGESWSAGINISNAVNAGNHNQGVNLGTGPNGEVYAVWAIYDSWPSDENAIGFARSYDGGVTWEPATRILENIRGVRTSETSKDQRVNSFPSMDVDISDGNGEGNIYVVWPNIGEPGVNQGPDIDIYMIKSEDEGETWSEPIRVNQDLSGQGNEHYMSWVCCDPVTGFLSVVYYDDRNVGANECEVYCSNSTDQGETWEDIKVSDVSFTPSPIPGLAFGYFGDYLGIDAYNGLVYPCWTDNRSGHALCYVSPYQLISVNDPYGLTADLNDETGEVELNWHFSFNPGFEHFKIRRNGLIIGTTSNTTFSNQLPDYGIYTYSVTAAYAGNLLSNTIYETVQWGSPQMTVNPDAIYDTVFLNEFSTEIMEIDNSGELPLIYRINLYNTDREILEFCPASGGCGPYISEVQVGDIMNTSGCDMYTDYTDQSTDMMIAESYEITVINGQGSPFDICGIWIDWNQNEDFSDDYPVVMSGSPGIGPYTATITPPPYALEGQVRMRIRIIQTGDLYPCGDTDYGEVEDYSINVSNWISITPAYDTVFPGDSILAEIEVDGSKVTVGDHSYNLVVKGNDLNNPVDTIAYELTVLAMLAQATADPYTICAGESSTLDVEVTGGSGNYTYSWTSDPAGFTSDAKNPTFEGITENTTFFVAVDDGEYQVQASASVNVLPSPEVELGDIIAICEGDTYLFDAGPGYESYLWSDGSTSQTLEVSEAGFYWVEVTNDTGCSGSDTAELIVNPLPQVDLGDIVDICTGDAHTFDAGAGYQDYLWQDGSHGQTFTTGQAGEYWVEVIDDFGCANRDTAQLVVNDLPVVNLGQDTMICKDQLITLDAGNPGATYLWSNGETSQTIVVDSLTFSIGLHEIWCEVTSPEECTGKGYISVEINNCYYGIDEMFAHVRIDIYPNPNDGVFNISFNTVEQKNINLKVYSSTGSVVYTNDNLQVFGSYHEQIRLDMLRPGIYLINFEIEGQYKMKKILVR